MTSTTGKSYLVTPTIGWTHWVSLTSRVTLNWPATIKKTAMCHAESRRDTGASHEVPRDGPEVKSAGATWGPPSARRTLIVRKKRSVAALRFAGIAPTFFWSITVRIGGKVVILPVHLVNYHLSDLGCGKKPRIVGRFFLGCSFKDVDRAEPICVRVW